jgi:hypothetical protein
MRLAADRWCFVCGFSFVVAIRGWGGSNGLIIIVGLLVPFLFTVGFVPVALGLFAYFEGAAPSTASTVIVFVALGLLVFLAVSLTFLTFSLARVGAVGVVVLRRARVAAVSALTLLLLRLFSLMLLPVRSFIMPFLSLLFSLLTLLFSKKFVYVRVLTLGLRLIKPATILSRIIVRSRRRPHTFFGDLRGSGMLLSRSL